METCERLNDFELKQVVRSESPVSMYLSNNLNDEVSWEIYNNYPAEVTYSKNLDSPPEDNSNTSAQVFNNANPFAVISKEERAYSGKHDLMPFRTIRSNLKVYHYCRERQISRKKSSLTENNLRSDSGNTDELTLCKHELLNKIDKLDEEIMETEQKIEIMKSEMKSASNKMEKRRNASIGELTTRIYNENLSKASASHDLLMNVSKCTADYTNVEPGEIDVLKKIIKDFHRIRFGIMAYMHKKRSAKSKGVETEASLPSESYNTVWKTELEKMENCQDRIKRNVKDIQLFEKVFPILRIEREHKELMEGLSMRTRNQPYVKDYIRFLRDRHVPKDLRGCIPVENISSLLVRREREQYYQGQGDGVREFLRGPEFTAWTDEERKIFKEKYLESPKNFIYIASQIKGKSTSDCILFYYRTKKKENYKLLVNQRKAKVGRPRCFGPPERGQAEDVSSAPVSE